MTFHDRDQVEALLDGLVIVELSDSEFDGPSGRGPKHWHGYDVVARA
ncbi:hypothetical protein GCM10023169_34710 [Georgenia halophila]|uniref:Uncharacterized protein n=2 Tax=Georgenia halophila TaxID=620889 RepID=A0ABP8LM15_9MICO